MNLRSPMSVMTRTMSPRKKHLLDGIRRELSEIDSRITEEINYFQSITSRIEKLPPIPDRSTFHKMKEDMVVKRWAQMVKGFREQKAINYRRLWTAFTIWWYPKSSDNEEPVDLNPFFQFKLKDFQIAELNGIHQMADQIFSKQLEMALM